MTDEVEFAAMRVRAEAAAAGHGDSEEWLSCCAANYAQATVRGWRENIRKVDGFGATSYPAAILALGSGLCQATVISWMAILERLGIGSREIGLAWDDGEARTHVCGEARWRGTWHFFDVQLGTVWQQNNRIVSWRRVRQMALEGVELPCRISNSMWVRWSAIWSDPFGYLASPTLQVFPR